MYYIYYEQENVKYISKNVLELNLPFITVDELPENFFSYQYKVINNSLVKQPYITVEPINYNPENKYNTTINFVVKCYKGNDYVDGDYNEHITIKTNGGILNNSEGYFVHGVFYFSIIIPDYISERNIHIQCISNNLVGGYSL